MKKVQSERLGDHYWEIKHPSGLDIFLYPKEKSNTTCAIFGTKYGSIDNRFLRSDETVAEEVPEGIAHFLEHKLFESQEGDAFQRFALTGASANAFTSNSSTCYFFSCTDRLYESLEILLDFVQSPYFTEESVKKELGIIGQEIKMYEDDPDSRASINLLRAMYKNHPVRIDIAGTVESIAKITPEHLYRCYNTFYNLHNMALVIAGDFDADEIMKVCDANLKPCEEVSVERVFDQEPDEVLQHLVEDKLPVASPLFCFGFKERAKLQMRNEKECAAINTLLSILASSSSPLYQDLLDRELINESFSSGRNEGSGYAHTLFVGESRDPAAVAEAIVKEIERLKRSGIPEDAFERAKRALYGANISAFNSVFSIANGIINMKFSGKELFAHIDALAELRMEDCLEALSDIRTDTSVLSVIRPV